MTGTTEQAGRRIYLAARYSRNAEMRGVRDVLEALGHKVTSRWIEDLGGKYGKGSFTPDQLNGDPAYCADIARRDLEDVADADTMISFTEAGGGGKGGRHVELGLALGLGLRLVLVGPREHVFHTLPDIEWYPDWAHLVMAWAPSFAGQAS